MVFAIDRLGRAAAAVTLVALAWSAPPASAASWQLAQAAPAPAVTDQTPARPRARRAMVHQPPSFAALTDFRIADLHKRLQITAAQEPQFNAMAEVMRANAQSADDLLHEESQETDRTAVSGLRWYERLTEGHAQALHKFVPAFAALYGVLSDSQKKTADGIFQRIGLRPPPRHSRSK